MAHRFFAYSCAGIATLFATGCLKPISCEETLTCPQASHAHEDTGVGSAEGGLDAAPLIEGGVDATPQISTMGSSRIDAAGSSVMAVDAAVEPSTQIEDAAAAALDASLDFDSSNPPEADAADATSTNNCANCGPHATCAEVNRASECVCESGYVREGDICERASCSGLTARCGASLDNCCASPEVIGGSFELGDPAMSAVTVATFALDKYEVTVGRFRKFVEAYAGAPAPGAGAHPLIPGSGWQSVWDGAIAGNAADLASAVLRNNLKEDQTWSTTDIHDLLPMNQVSWYEAFAFCAWDGGRLPTEAEWEYAAAGGSEERTYPWGSDDPLITLAVYDCRGDGSPAEYCGAADILPVGSRPMGAGRYGQLDLAGSMAEWTLDTLADPYPATCNNCANINTSFNRVVRGGGWSSYGPANLPVATRYNRGPATLDSTIGFRCARTTP